MCDYTRKITILHESGCRENTGVGQLSAETFGKIANGTRRFRGIDEENSAAKFVLYA